MQVARHEAERRKHNGHDIAHCNDPDHKFYPQRQICRADMERAAAAWRYDDLHEDAPFHDGSFENWAEKRSLQHPYHYKDGVTILVAEVDLYPDDLFLGEGTSDSPDLPPAPNETR